jgi:DNA-binding CsgD family transcriptional regulator
MPSVSTAFAGVPAAVRDSLPGELEAVSRESRAILDAGAVAGDPFAGALVAEIAECGQRDALAAIDQAIVTGLVHGTEVPGYFAFRHPIVRHAVYELTPSAWRVGAHAPASAARWFGAAVRLLDENVDPGRRIALLVSLATALTAAGALDRATKTLAEVLDLLPADQPLLRARVLAGMTVVERLLGGSRSARSTLAGTLEQLPEPPSVESVALSIELAADRYFEGDWAGMLEPARRARDLAAGVEDASLSAAAAAVLGLAEINAGHRPEALAQLEQAISLLDHLADHQLVLHLGAAHWVGWCAHHLGRHEEVVRQYDRALALARAHEQSHLVVPMLLGLIISNTWLGRIERALEDAEIAIEIAHLLDAEQLRQARGALLVCGAERLADLAARELRRLGEHVSRSRPGRDTLPGLASLSQRELEVARLVADRLTNRQITQQLIISEKTVERHLAHIFEKLGVDSRVTVARMVEGAAAQGP